MNEEFKTINFQKKIKQIKKSNNEKRQDAFKHHDVNQFNALHYACMYGHSRCVILLVEEARIAINSKVASGYTALHIAARNNRREICKYLVEEAKPQRANVLSEGLERDTPRKSAEELGHAGVAEYLLYHEKRMMMWQNKFLGGMMMWQCCITRE